MPRLIEPHQLHAFADMLAAHLGGTVSDDYADSHWQRAVDLPDGLRLLCLTGNWAGPGRVKVAAHHPDGMKIHAAGRRIGGGPSCTVAASRPMVAVAKDVQRRVVTPGRAWLEEANATLADLDSRARDLATCQETYRALLPGLRFGDASPDGTCCRFDYYAKARDLTRAGYVHGTLYHDGTISVERMALPGDVESARDLFALFAKWSES